MKVQNDLAWQLQAPDDGRSSRLYVALTSAEAAAWPRLHGPGRMCVSRTVVGGGWGLHRICLLRNGLHHTPLHSSRWGPSTMSIMTPNDEQSCPWLRSCGVPGPAWPLYPLPSLAQLSTEPGPGRARPLPCLRPSDTVSEAEYSSQSDFNGIKQSPLKWKQNCIN